MIHAALPVARLASATICPARRALGRAPDRLRFELPGGAFASGDRRVAAR